MKPLLVTVIALLPGLAVPSLAQQSAPGGQAQAATRSAPSMDIADAAKPAVQVVDAFSAALAKSNMSEVERLLASDVIILESGGAEHSRAEYLGHHAKADAKFLSSAHNTLVRRKARAEHGLAWVASESELHVTRGKPVTLRSTETMILRSTSEGWRIVHIHWSSKAKSNS